MLRKKLLSLLLLSVFILSVTGCTPSATEDPEDIVASQYGVATATVGGAFYPMGQALATVVNDNTDYVELAAEVTNGAVENPRLLHNHESDIGITNSHTAYFAYAGQAPYEGKLDVLALGNLHPSVFHIVVKASSDITTIEDLRGKRVAVGTAGGASVNFLSLILEQYGISIEEINPSYLPYSDGFSQMSDGNVDAAVALSGYPAAAVLEASTSHELRFLEMEQEVFDGLLEEYPYYTRIYIPADVYGNEEPIAALGIRNMLICRTDMDETDVYEITKALYGNLTQLKEINTTAQQIDDATVSETSIPLHPGAQKYFDEVK